ncbi:MAG: 5'-methylthioadenosine/S-adenosylhomocysteine nucleosidase [Bdellovibrionales bacterium]|nr:5'-methylthioadenosine/S-adenosylhomocysteine nucleosidase [Bdellovibrionales bacterium]
MKTLVLCPLKPELNVLLDFLKNEGIELHETLLKTKKSFHSPKLSCIFACGGHGKSRFASTTHKFLVEVPTIETVICLGTAGSLAPPTKPLDVVVGTSSIEHDSKEGPNDNKLATYESPAAKNLQKSKLQNRSFQVHFAPIASGAEDIVSSTRAKEIYEKTGALAVAWEGFGGACTAHAASKTFLEIRGITDNANPHAYEDFQKNLTVTIQNASRVLLQLLPF